MNCLCCSFRLAIPTAVPAIPGIAPMAAAMIGIRAGNIPPLRCFLDRRVPLPVTPVLLLRRRTEPEPEKGTATAVVPVVKSLAVTGSPLEAAARAASEAAGGG